MAVPSLEGRRPAAERAAPTSVGARKLDSRSFEALYRRYRRDVSRLCARKIGDVARAEELAQEAFLRAYLHREDFDRGKAFWPWISTIARNLCTDELRARPCARLEPLHDLPESKTPSAPDHTADIALDRVEAVALRRRLVAALGQLGPREREILWMRDAEERSYEEISRTQGATVNAVRNLSWRARGTMRALLGDLSQRIPGLGAVLATWWSMRRALGSGKRAVLRRLTRVAQRLTLLAEPIVAVVVGLAISFAAAQGLGKGSDVPRSFVTLSNQDPSSPAVGDDARRAALGAGREERQRHAGSGGFVRLTAEIDRRDGAALPHRSRLRVEVWGPKGRLFWTEAGVNCSPREGDLLPGEGPVRTDC